ncbi:MAG: hypothetical protein ACOX5L_07075 [Bacteroidales bacterium]
MKRLIIIAFWVIACFAQAQELPSIPSNGFAFPLGSKFTIKLIPTEPGYYDYSVIAFEPFQEIVDTYEKEHLFEKEGEENSIVCYFCLGTHGETEEEMDKNMKILLIFKSYSKELLSYTSEIQREEDGEYEETSNVGAFPGVLMTEMWPYMIYSIGLRNFRNFGTDPKDPVIVGVDKGNQISVKKMEKIFHQRFQYVLSHIGQLQFNDIVAKEEEWGGVDNTPDHKVSVGESYYPNPNQFIMDTYREYSYKSSLIEHSAGYHATKENGLVRVVFLEWSEPFLVAEELEDKVLETFQDHLLFLENMIVKEAGNYIDYQDKENHITRIWKTESGVTIHLEHMKNYSGIRMVIYKE